MSAGERVGRSGPDPAPPAPGARGPDGDAAAPGGSWARLYALVLAALVVDVLFCLWLSRR